MWRGEGEGKGKGEGVTSVGTCRGRESVKEVNSNVSVQEPDAEWQREHKEWLKTRAEKVLAIWRSLMESQFARLKT